MIDLETATTPHDGRIHIPMGWRQGRGAYGGLVVAAMIRAIEQRVADPARPVRAVTAELPAPVDAGSAELSVEILRAGHSVTAARCALVQDGTIRAHAVAILAGSRPDAPTWNDLRPPDAPAWPPHVPPATGLFPEFAQNFEYRVIGGVPFSGGAPEAVGWIRARQPGGKRDAAYIAAMIDAWYPGAMVRLREMRPLATIAYTLDLISPLDGLPADAFLLYRGVAPVAADGYFVETRELWGSDGRLVALNHQTFAVIK